MSETRFPKSQQCEKECVFFLPRVQMKRIRKTSKRLAKKYRQNFVIWCNILTVNFVIFNTVSESLWQCFILFTRIHELIASTKKDLSNQTRRKFNDWQDAVHDRLRRYDETGRTTRVWNLGDAIVALPNIHDSFPKLFYVYKRNFYPFRNSSYQQMIQTSRDI